ncbi:GNAT family N-acetyltransferase [Acidithiobacillus sp.]
MSTVQVHCDKRISPSEFASLMASVGWGAEGDYDPGLVRQSIRTYPFVAHARTEDDALVGYVSAFSDGVFSTFIGELVVHPKFQRQGVGTQLLQAVESNNAGVSIYAKPFTDQQGFFLRNGYCLPKRAMSVVSKRL